MAEADELVSRTEFLFRSREQFLEAYDPTGFPDGGVFCATRRRMDEGAHVQVRVRLGRRRPPVLLLGQVVWRRQGRNSEHIRAGLGIAFLNSEQPKLLFVLDTQGSESPKSRRRHERVPINLTVAWRFEGAAEAMQGTLRDVGRGGAFMRTNVRVNSDAPVVVEVAPPGAAVAMSFAGRVAWIGRNNDEQGFGLEWRARDAGGGRRIKELVRRLATAIG